MENNIDICKLHSLFEEVELAFRQIKHELGLDRTFLDDIEDEENEEEKNGKEKQIEPTNH